MKSNFMVLAESFLHCKHETLPFKYIGLSMRVTPLFEYTYGPHISHILRRLLCWSHGFVSLSKRVASSTGFLTQSQFSTFPLWICWLRFRIGLLDSWRDLCGDVLKMLQKLTREFSMSPSKRVFETNKIQFHKKTTRCLTTWTYQ